MRVTDLIRHYQMLVLEIPEDRPLVRLPEETMLQVLTHLEANHTIDESNTVLIGSCMRAARGHANPADVAEAITWWRNCDRT